VGIFDLVLIFTVLASIATLIAVAVVAVTGRFALAGRMLFGWGLCIAAYLGIVVIVSLFTPPRLLAIGENACFDDWCVAIDHVEKTHAPEAETQTYAVTFRLSSRARRVRQRERNFVPYIRDADGRRYDTSLVTMGEPFDVELGPGQSVRTTRIYQLAATAQNPQLVLAHEGGFPIGWFIIGEGPFSKGILVAMR
jgi:hypothetical protein